MKINYHGLRPAAGAVVCAVVIFLSTASLHAAGQILQKPGSTHVPVAVANGQPPIGTLADTNLLNLAFSLPLRNQKALDAYLQQVSDPKSPIYRQYLSVAQFAEKYGATKADYEAVRAFAKANGLNITKEHANRLVLTVQASVADINRAFHLNIRTYKHPTEDRMFYAPDAEPALNLSVPVLHISGLDNFVIPHPLGLKPLRPIGKSHPFGGGGTNVSFGGSGPGDTYISPDLRNAYAPGVSLNGSGQSVALFEFDSYFPSDIVAYEQQTGLPTENVVPVLIDGGTGSPGGGSGEVTLDIDMVMAMAPGINTIYVYESPGDATTMISTMAVDDTANQISSSWGFGGDPGIDQLYKELAAQGQSYFQASGDSGAFDGPGGPENIGPYSGESPYITLVGGTELVMNGKGVSYASESVWGTGQYYPGNWGSSGGICTFYPIPVWQQGINMTTNEGSTVFRNSPDVALCADNVYIVYGGQGQGSGGTSAAAPQWAAFNSMINQQAALFGISPDGFVNPAVYALCKTPQYTNYFHDCTNGNNEWPSFPDQFPAVPGYDLCTGWGTPTGSNLINAIVPPVSEPVLLVVTNVISGGPIYPGSCTSVSFLITNEGLVGATGIQGYLYSTTLGAIVAQSTASFPDLPPHTDGLSITPFTVSTETTFVCGTPIDLVLILKSDQVGRTNTPVLSTGIIGPPASVSNSTPYVIPQGSGVGIYSPVTVSNLQAAEKITVSVYSQVEYDEGLTLTLIAPNGSNVQLTAFPNGGLGANYGTGCSFAAETTFDDDATNTIGSGTAPFAGSWQPTQPLSSLLPLSGTNLNGVWQLNAVEQFTGDPATLECWSLNVTPYVCGAGSGQCPGSDLYLTMTESPNPALVYSNVVYNMTISNAGPSDAAAVVISQGLPPGFGFVGISNYPAQATLTGTNLTLSLGTLPVYGTAMVSVVTIPTIPEVATSTATAGLTGSDPDPNNGIASVTTVVEVPTADLAVSMSASPPALLQGGQVTYTIVVTNNGPFTATGVVLTNVLPANVNYISSSTSQGNVSLASLGSGVIFDVLDTLPTGTNAVFTVTVSPVTTGNYTDRAQVGLSLSETDPVSYNNTATFTVTVGPAADLAVSATVSPPTVIAGSNYTYVATVVNNGPSPATGVGFTQTIPGGTGLNASTFVSSSPSTGVTVTNGSISWNIGNLASGASTIITTVLKSPTIPHGGNPIVLSSTFSVFGQPGNAFTNASVVTVSNLVEPPTITIDLVSALLVSQSGSNQNGAINPGQNVEVQFYLQNVGNVSTTNLQATLLASNGVTLPSGNPQTYGALAPGAPPVGGSFGFLASGTNGGSVVALLALTDGTNNLGTNSHTFYFPVVQTFWNTNPVYIPATNFVPEPDSGPGSPYPASIQVSNLSGYVSKVTVTVSNLSHTYPHDIGLLLVGPETNVVLMDAVAQASSPTVDATLVFDSTAGTALPSYGNLTGGTYQPADYNPGDVFTNAMTLPGTNLVASPYSTNLAGFIGQTANGTWSLYSHDNVQGDGGGISNGWAVTITTIIPVNPTNSLAASIVASTNQATLGNSVTYQLSVTNNGLSLINGYLTNVLPAGLKLISGSSSNFTQMGTTYIYDLGSLSPGAGVTITNVLLAISNGFQTNTISAGVPQAAFNTSGNTASVVTAVNLPLADVAAGIAVAPVPAIVNSNITFTLSITNLGPSNALASTGSFSLGGLTLVSVSDSQGSFTNVNGTVTNYFGTILPGDIAIATITAVSTNVGTVTNSWSVGTTSGDTNLANNSVSFVSEITNAKPIIAPVSAVLVSQGLTPPNGAINANESVTMAFTLTNEGYIGTSNLMATLLATNGITPTGSITQSYGAISVGSTGTLLYTFTATGAAGAYVTPVLALTDGINLSTNISFGPFMIPVTNTYARTDGIIINQYYTASPYPSTINVTGLTNAQGSNLLVSKVTVTLNGFSHTFPHDVNVLLESPSGQEIIIMGHAGGAYSVTNLNLTFADAATQPLPAGQLPSNTNETYLPTDYPPVDLFPGLPAASASSNLASLNGETANGSWSLYVFDDTQGNGGFITGGWSLGLTAVSTVNPAALLSASMISSPNPVDGGNYLNYQITVTNEGPGVADNVVITDTLPTSVTFHAAVVSQGTYSASNGIVTCQLGSISNGATATATITVVAGALGTIVNNASVSTSSADLYLAASTTVNSTTVEAPPYANLFATNFPGGVLQLTLKGQAGQNYAIQTSSNLFIWSSVYTNTASINSGSFIYTDTRTNAPLRFYRAVPLAQ